MESTDTQELTLHPIIQRIRQFCYEKQMTTKQLSKLIDFPYGTLSNYVGGRRLTIDVDLICKFASTYTDISLDWLILGLGDMYKGGNDVAASHPQILEPISVPRSAVEKMMESAIEQQEEEDKAISDNELIEKIIGQNNKLIDYLLKKNQ